MDLSPVAAQLRGCVAVVNQPRLKPADLAGDPKFFVDDGLGEAAPAVTEKADKPWLLRRSPIVLQLLSEKLEQPPHAIGAEFVISDRSSDLGGEFRGDFLVGVEAEDPGAGGLINPEVLLGPKARPIPIDHAGAERCGFLPGAVFAVRVDDDRFRGPGHAPKAALDVRFFVLGDYDDRDRFGQRVAPGVRLRTARTVSRAPAGTRA